MAETRKKSIMATIYIASIIGCLEAYALSKGINGTCLTVSMAALAGLGGFSLKGIFPDLKIGGKDNGIPQD